MKLKLLVLPVVLLAVLMSVASEVKAVSEAAVLYLRIAPGARASGMGEAFVAVADDATTTHWNPAGLGAYPLAEAWPKVSVPAHLQPLRGIAPLKAGGGQDYESYELWSITAKGLARYHNHSWNFGETFHTKSSQTVRQIVASYFNETDEERIASLARRVAETNNKKTRDYLVTLADSTMAIFPEDHESYASARNHFDSLIAAFDECRVDWEYVTEVEKLRDEAIEDGSVTEVESDRISFAVEKARQRTIYEELVIPYGVALGGEITSIASTGEHVVVGTDKGVLVFNGKNWTTITAEAGLPGEYVTTLSPVGRSVLVGTDNGLALVTGSSLAKLPGSDNIPAGSIDAIGARSMQDIWVVIDSHLHHFNGTQWRNGMSYTVTANDTKDKLADKFSIYGTQAEKERYLELLQSMYAAQQTASAEVPDIAPDTTTADTARVDTAMADTITPETAATDTAMSETEPATPIPPVEELSLEPGMQITIPFSAGIKGRVNAILVDENDVLLIGTEYGILRFTPSGWTLLGYREYTVSEGETFEDIVNQRRFSGRATPEHYRQALMAVNGLEDPQVATGEVIKVYSAPLAAETFQIQRRIDAVYAATAEGLLSYDGTVWQRADQTGMGRQASGGIASFDENLWILSGPEITAKANNRNEISFTYFKWLPDLADDLYYSFVSFVTNKEGLGTLAGSATFISYGTFERRGEGNEDLGTFESFDVAFALSYGTALTSKLSGGVTAKFLYSRLADQGQAAEQGSGKSTGFAVDFGLLYKWTPRLSLGLAITNLGPDMTYIDAAQSDPLPRNIGFGVAYKLLQSDYYHFLVTVEANKLLADPDDLKSVIFNGGAEFQYADLIAFRAGYIYDDEGDVKTATLGAGLTYSPIRFDFSYYPSSGSSALANTLKTTVSIYWY